MFPDYRKSAAQRRDDLAGFLIGCVCVASAVSIGCVVYVMAHFIVKFW